MKGAVLAHGNKFTNIISILPQIYYHRPASLSVPSEIKSMSINQRGQQLSTQLWYERVVRQYLTLESPGALNQK